MSTQEMRDKMLLPQDPAAKDTPRSNKDPVNWAIHGGLPESFEGGKSPKRKQATNEASTDLLRPVAETKLPPQIITHNNDGSTNEKHSANDERFSNEQVADVQDASINESTPIKVNPDKPATTEPVNQDQNKTAATPPSSNKRTSQQTSQEDPALKTR